MKLMTLFTSSLVTLAAIGGLRASETVLFPFDDHALPFSKGLILTLAK